MKEFDKIVWNEYSKGRSLDFVEDKRGNLSMTAMPFHVHCANDNTKNQAIRYSVDGKYISFTPISIGIDGNIIKNSNNRENKILSKSKLEYNNIFGDGINLDVEVNDKDFNKVIVINSLSNLGTIPENAKNLEITFKIDTDCNFWNKTDDLIFEDDIQFTENSTINGVRAWYVPILTEDDTEEERVEKNKNSILKCKGKFYKDGNSLYLTKYIPIQYIKDLNVPIYTDIVISYGSKVNVDTTGSASAIKAVSLSDNTIVIIYIKDPGSGQYFGFCRVGYVSGTSITYGTENYYSLRQSDLTNNYAHDITALSSSKVAIVFNDSQFPSSTITIIGEVYSTNNIAFYDEYVVNSSNANYFLSVSTISTTSYIVAYRDNSNNNGTCVICTVSGGGTVTVNTKYHFKTAVYAPDISVCVLSSSSFILCYSNSANSYYGTALIGTISGTTISYGSEYVYSTATTTKNNAIRINDQTAVIAYLTSATQYKLIVASISGTDISFGTALNVGSANGPSLDVTKLTENNIVVTWNDIISSQYKGISALCSISGTSLTLDTTYYFETNDFISYVSIVSLSTTKFCNAYRNVSDYLVSVIGTVPEWGKKINSTTYSKWNNTTITKWNNQ